MKHVHCELIKAWADGKEIEIYHANLKKWIFCENPGWQSNWQYRIKPEEPDYGRIAKEGWHLTPWTLDEDNTNWNNAANAVIEAYKKHHNLP